MRKLLSALFMMALVFGFCSTVAADAPTKPKVTTHKDKPVHKTIEEKFKDLDTDGDGKISLEEFTAGLEGKKKEAKEKTFKRWDIDGDGFLTLDEFKAHGHVKPTTSDKPTDKSDK